VNTTISLNLKGFPKKSWTQCYQTFFDRKLQIFEISDSVCPCRPSPMFVSKAGAYPRVEHQKGASLDKALALFANISLGWNGFPWTNTLAYYEHSEIRGNCFVTFYSRN